MEKQRFSKEFAPEDLRGRTHFISLNKANKLIENFHENRSSLIPQNLQDKDKEVGILPYSETFNVKSILKALQQKGCEGLRIHMGLNEDFQVVFVLRAVDEFGEDMLSNPVKPIMKTAKLMSFSAGADEDGLDEGFSLDDSQRVPPWPVVSQ
ncbi:hypothetical protein [Pedobacter punctiformis]|uniref:Uncharacterized protein n=1 Tax=Pedobacter punctiformis TaxID=3004097 RepID=A0ABT4L937_9SPHI|nr:hypothetical protein [Pedobacter sp. HCMS5-2]MCZ4244346.1 hypothetical protein [Pedobacter sp. HCMS5-2]